MAGMAGFEPAKCQSQSLVPYRLATSQSMGIINLIFTYVNPTEKSNFGMLREKLNSFLVDFILQFNYNK